ncbi:MAG: cyclic nucleotide-binding domain-containing protein [Cyanobacteriota bacterium]|nr:cyclic nucleotide-binding domain-containing protein [Cyanobacteriota bacterium]
MDLSTWPELSLRRWRWLLLGAWLLLIVSLLLPNLTLPEAWTPQCAAGAPPPCELHRQPGNRLFWGAVVPTGVLLIGVVSHELWRRICPLAFVSQLGRALGWQRSRSGKGGRPEVVKVEADSWLGRHHIELQWTLLIAGLCLRLLGLNSSPLGLAALLLVTLLAAVLVGWAYGGKAWCQYVCPMGPVQTVLTGLRGPLGSTAHWGTSSRLTQSMCRTVAADGREQSACVACQAPCIDIDAERAFWQTSRGRRGLRWAWLSYPGLVLAFFWLMEETVDGSDLLVDPIGYLRSGAWAFDAGLAQRAWLPLEAGQPLPRLLLIPLALAAAAATSVGLFGVLETGLQRLYRRQGQSDPQDRALLHTRLLATFVAINTFFWFVDPLQGALGLNGGQLLRSLVLTLSAIALFRSWSRDQATYRRESSSESLRRQLRDLPGLEVALDGRSLEALSPVEVYTLVKALPAVGRQQAVTVYRGVMAEMLRTGRLERAAALLELQDLRAALGLEDSDHHGVVRVLAVEQPELLQHDRLQRQRDELRREAAAEAIEELLRQEGLPLLDSERLSPPLAGRLAQIAESSGLDPDLWQALLQRFGPRGELERQRLDRLRQRWLAEVALQSPFATMAAGDPLLRPLLQALLQRGEGLRRELEERLAQAGLEPLPAMVEPQLGGAAVVPQVLELLWSDPDPDTAAWALMCARERDPQLAAQLLQIPRSGLGESPFLHSQRHSIEDPDRDEWPVIAASALFADLLPAGLLWVSRQGHLQHLEPAEVLMQQGASSDSLALVISGSVCLTRPGGQQVELGPGQSVGEMGVITTQPRSASVCAGRAGAQVFILPASVFEDLLQRSTRFSRGLLVQLAERLARA